MIVGREQRARRPFNAGRRETESSKRRSAIGALCFAASLHVELRTYTSREEVRRPFICTAQVLRRVAFEPITLPPYDKSMHHDLQVPLAGIDGAAILTRRDWSQPFDAHLLLSELESPEKRLQSLSVFDEKNKKQKNPTIFTLMVMTPSRGE